MAATTSAPALSPRASRALVPPTITLAFQRLREVWGLLLVTGLGMLSAVVLVCAVPLYSQVAMTAGMRSVLASFSQNDDIVVRTRPSLVSTQVIDATTQQLAQEMRRNLGTFLAPPQISIQTQLLNILRNSSTGGLQPFGGQIALISSSMDEAPAHAQVLAGRLPQALGQNIEIAITPDTAIHLGVSVGTILPVSLLLITGSGHESQVVLNLHIVGIFTPNQNDPFWHGNDFSVAYNFYALVSTQTILNALNTISNQASQHLQAFEESPDLLWYYSLDTSRISVNDLDTIIAGLQNVQIDNANSSQLQQPPFLQETTTSTLSLPVLQSFHSRLSIAQLPVSALSVLMLALVLLFVSMMATLLVERQGETIAVLRSRGASRRQVFGSVLAQSIGLGILALLVGPVLAILIVYWLAQVLLSSANASAFNIITGNMPAVLALIAPFALLTIGIALLAVVFAVFSATQRDVLAIRREAARSTSRPLWQRLNLDLLAVVLALVAAGVSIYLTRSGVLDQHLRLLLLSPLTLAEALCILLAGLLLLLRGFPRLLGLGAWLANRRRGASSMLALAQVSRAPQQATRMTLLLALASAFAIFTLIFSASQTQRVQDVSRYQAGADFSGPIPVTVYSSQEIDRVTRLYKRIPGVTSATLGNVVQAEAGSASAPININVQSVDANTFAGTGLWTSQDASQSLSSLMAQLRNLRSEAITSSVVPAIVDANTWDTLHLSAGTGFTLKFPSIDYSAVMHFIAVAEVQHIPTPGDSSEPEILTDYRTFAETFSSFLSSGALSLPINYVWLRTRDDARSLASVRKVLSDGALRLSPLYDRRAIAETLYSEPLYLTLIGILELGALVALLLALIGNLVSSWLSARARLTSFAILRALGATPRQIASVLTWEQGMIYAAALLLGVISGFLLAFLALPGLIFSSVLPNQFAGDVTTTSADFYAAQNTPPIQIITPPSLWIALGVLVVICVIALALMMFVVSRPTLSQALRLNED
jgi:ABC-type antimicrobial peptide transport system permease subunit